jgi:xanthine dehydrogenase molybdopterin-binding subunit B
MEHIANVVKKDPVDVRLANIKQDVIPKMIQDMKEMSDYDKRVQEIEQYNKVIHFESGVVRN